MTTATATSTNSTTTPTQQKAVSANKNATTTIVLEPPVLYHAIFPIGYDLQSNIPAELNALPSQQQAINDYTQSLSDRTLINAPLQPGWLTIFREGVLWKEFEVRSSSISNADSNSGSGIDTGTDTEKDNSQTTLHEVNLATQQTLDHRIAEGDATHYFLLPEGEECEIAFSDIQWPWLLISHMGGLLEEPHPEEIDWPYLLPENQQCRVDDDPRLYQWSKSTAAKQRKNRCQNVKGSNSGKHHHHQRLEITQQENAFIPDALQSAEFSATDSLTKSLSQHINQASSINLLNASYIGSVLSNRYHNAWGLMQDTLERISTPYEESDEFYEEFPHSKYYESALLAHQVYFAELPNKYDTLWERDNLQLKHRDKLKLNDIQQTLGVDLRATIRAMIEKTGNDLADFLQGEFSEFGKEWLDNFTAQLEDTWAFTEMPSNLQEDEDDATQQQFRHIRWEKLANVLTKLADHPASLCQHIDGTPALRQEMQDGKTNDPGYKVLNAILRGKHPLSSITLNEPKDLHFSYQETLVEFIEQHKDGGKPDPSLMNTIMQQISALTAASFKGQENDDPVINEAALKISLATVKWVFGVAGQLFVGSAALEVERINSSGLNAPVEAIRQLLNSATNASINYTSFEGLLESQSNTPDGNKKKQMIIATMLSSMQEKQTQVSVTDTPEKPDIEAEKIKAEADAKINALSKTNQQERNQFKRIEGKKNIDKDIAALNASKNHNRSVIAESGDKISALMDDIKERYRPYTDNGIISDDAYSDPEIKQLEQKKNSISDTKQKAHDFTDQANKKIADLEALKIELEVTRKTNTTASSDKNTLLKNINTDSPLYPLKQLDDTYLQEVDNINSEAQARILKYNEKYTANQKTLSDLHSEGVDAHYSNTTEGQEIAAFKKAQQEKLAQLSGDPFTIKYTDKSDFETTRTKYADKANTIVLTPAQSAVMTSEQKASYLVVGEEGKHIYRESKAADIQTRQQTTIMISTVMVGLDMCNVLMLLHKWKESGDSPLDAKDYLDAVGAFTGTAAGIGEVMNNNYQAKQLSANTARTSTMARQINTSKVFNVGVLKVMPATAAVSGILTASYDGYYAVLRGDDVAYAHLVAFASGATALLAVGWLSAAFILGPISLALAVTALILQRFVFTEDNMLDTWLEKGPFSEEKDDNLPRFRPIPRFGWQHTSEVSEQLKQRMGIQHHSVWLGGVSVGKATELKDKEGKYRRLLSLKIPSHSIALILDQNYQLLGLKYIRSYQSHDNVVFNDITGDISVIENGITHKLGRIGETMGANSWSIRDALIDNIPSFNQASLQSDISSRFEDDWSDDDKFSEPMKKYPAASLELLLNGLYPLKAEFELMPVEKTFVKRTIGRSGKDIYEMKGNRAKVTVDLPYFVEGVSTLMIEFRVARESNEQNRLGLPVIKFNDAETISKQNLSSLPEYTEDSSTGSYYSSTQHHMQFVQVIDFEKSTFDGESEKLKALITGRKIELECWIKLQITAPGKDMKNTINMPWKADSMWLSENPSIEATQNSWLTLTSEDILRN